MSTISCFEEIDVWQAARTLTKAVYKITQQGGFAKDFTLARQLHAASVSTMSNIAEGFDSGSKAEFIHFLSYTRRSASEVQSHLYVALDQDYITQEAFSDLYEQAQTVRKMVTSFMKYLRTEQASRRFNSSTRELANSRTREPRNIS